MRMPRARMTRLLLVLNLLLLGVLAARTPLLQASAAWQQGPRLATQRADHTATLLNDGDVLVVGGQQGGGVALATVERYAAAVGTWRTAAPLQKARAGHAATLLLDGRVLVIGGTLRRGAVARAMRWRAWRSTIRRTIAGRWRGRWVRRAPATVPRSSPMGASWSLVASMTPGSSAIPLRSTTRPRTPGAGWRSCALPAPATPQPCSSMGASWSPGGCNKVSRRARSPRRRSTIRRRIAGRPRARC